MSSLWRLFACRYNGVSVFLGNHRFVKDCKTRSVGCTVYILDVYWSCLYAYLVYKYKGKCTFKHTSMWNAVLGIGGFYFLGHFWIPTNSLELLFIWMNRIGQRINDLLKIRLGMKVILVISPKIVNVQHCSNNWYLKFCQKCFCILQMIFLKKFLLHDVNCSAVNEVNLLSCMVLPKCPNNTDALSFIMNLWLSCYTCIIECSSKISLKDSAIVYETITILNKNFNYFQHLLAEC